MWTNFISSDAVKFLIDLAKYAVQITDTLGTWPVLLGAIVGIFKIKDLQNQANGKIGFLTSAIDLLKSIKGTGATAKEAVSGISTFGEALLELSTNPELANTAIGKLSSSIISLMGGMEAAKSSTITLSTAMTTLKVGLVAVAAAVTLGIVAWNKYKQAQEEARQKAISDGQAYQDSAKSIKEYQKQVKELKQSLASGNLTEQETYEKRQQLLNIKDEVIKMFGAEAKSVDILTGSVESCNAGFETLLGNQANSYLLENASQIKKATAAMEAKTVYNAGIAWTGSQGLDEDIKKEIESIITQNGGQLIEDFDGNYAISIVADPKTVEESVNNIYAGFRQLEKDKGINLSDYLFGDWDVKMQEGLESVNKTLDQYQDIYDISIQMKIVADDDANNMMNQIDDAKSQIEEALSSGNNEDIQEAFTNFDIVKENLNKLLEDENLDQGVKDYLQNLVNEIEESSADYRAELNFELDFKENKNSLKDNLKNIITELGTKDYYEIQSIGIGYTDKYNRATNAHEQGNFDEEREIVDSMTAQEIAYGKLKSAADQYNISVETLLSALIKLKLVKIPDAEKEVIPVKTYSDISGAIEEYNEIQAQTEKIILNNTEVTEDYKQSLIDLGVNESDLNDCFDENNKLVVKNASNLRSLVKSTKSVQLQNIKLAKSQAAVDYYELFKEMNNYIDANGKVIEGTQDEIVSLYKEMGAIDKTITKYSLLEAELLGAADAYKEFEQAQTNDAEFDYMSDAESMALALGQAFNTAELGAETAQAAIKGLVPESVYEDLDTVDEKMAAIYDYFKNGKLSQYFTMEFDEDGSITSVEMKLGNLRKFIEDGLADDGVNVFDGTDWQHFQLSDEFMQQLEELPKDADRLQYFADKMGVTKEVALAFLKSLEDHDIEWLNGDYTSLLDQILPPTLEGNIHKATQKIAALNAEFAKGKIDEAEYKKQLAELNQELTTAKNASLKNMFGEDMTYDSNTEDADGYFEANQKVIDAQDKATTSTTKLKEAQEDLAEAKEKGLTGDDLAPYQQAVNDATQEVLDHEKELNNAINLRDEFATPTEAEMKIAIEDFDTVIAAAGTKFNEAIKQNFDVDENGYYTIKAGLDMSDLEAKYPGITAYINTLNSKTTIQAALDSSEAEITIETLSGQIDELIEILSGMSIDLDPTSVEEFSRQLGELCKPRNIIANLKAFWGGLTDNSGEDSEVNGTANVHGTAHVLGTAHKSGDWGLPKDEKDALMGELGEELVVNPRTGKYYTVGTNGAEMVDLPKDAIIFNHLQTKQLLENGHINSRGKAYAEGNAHLTIFSQGSSTDQWGNTGYSGPDDPTYDAADALGEAANDLSDAADDFEDTINWIEVLFNRIDNIISEQELLLELQADNTAANDAKKANYNTIFGTYNTKYYKSLEASKYYYDKAMAEMADIPAEYAEKIKNGTIKLEDFAGEENEALVEKINKATEYYDSFQTYTIQAYQTIADIQAKAKEQFDDVQNAYDNERGLNERFLDRVDAMNSLTENIKGFGAKTYLEQEIKTNETILEQYRAQRDALEQTLAEKVRLGQIEMYSQDWYDMVNAIYDVDDAIIDTQSSIEDLQNSINDLHWAKFDELMNRFGYLEDELGNIVQLLSHDVNGLVPEELDKLLSKDWANDSGLTTLGLYAQQMEMAQHNANQYAEAIKELKQQYAAGRYNETEYLSKLNELTSAQYENIEKYYDSRDAIVELNEARVDGIKNAIQKELDAYQELIDKKKEELNTEKGLKSFQNEIAEKEKDVANLKKQLAAMAGDTTAATTAKRKQLEAELLDAQKALEESYYDHSISSRQEALDKEYSSFEEEKNKEIENWEEYLKNVDTVVADSLNYVKGQTESIYSTLTGLGQQYGLSLSENITTPWSEGSIAVDNYSTKFETACSSWTTQLDNIASHWKTVQAEAEAAAASQLKALNQQVTDTQGAGTNSNPPTSNNNIQQQQKPVEQPKPAVKAITVGGKINAGSARIYANSYGGGGGRQYFTSDPIYTVLKEQNGYLLVRHHSLSSGYTGWFKKSDVKAYAQGTLGTKKNGLALVDELGEEELVLNTDGNGRLTYLQKGSAVLPSDLTERIFDLAMNPVSVMEDLMPKIKVPNITTNSFATNLSFDSLVHVDNCSQDTLPALQKMVRNEFNNMMSQVNNRLKRV